MRGLTGSLYGRRMYEIMRYWDGEGPEWTPEQHAFADAWRAMPKWVAPRSRHDVGPNATLVTGDVGAFARDLKQRQEGEIAVAGPRLAQVMTECGLIDVYRLYYHPVVLGQGTPFFAGAAPQLRLTGSERIGEVAIRLTCVPA